MSVPLLKTKLSVPIRQPALVARPRLIQRLDEGLRLGRKLALVSAPPGFGKTTLVQQWVADCGRPVGWVSLDSDDNDPSCFLAYLISALQSVDGELDQQPVTCMGPIGAPSMTEILARLLNQLSAMPHGVVVVLDDYHVIHAPQIHNGLSFLLDHLPSQLHLVIVSRADPPIPMARLRSQGQVTELRQDDLRFTDEEAIAFLNGVLGLALDPDDIAALDTRTEGWIAALQMAAIALQSPVPPGRHAPDLIRAFGGGDRHIADYLMEEVLQRQPDTVRSFLLRTSILETFTASLCDAVLDTHGSQAMLDVLERANLFIVPLDSHRLWYRYHSLFADTLRQLLTAQYADDLAVLHQRASVWYQEQGLVPPSVSHALLSQDWGRAAQLIEDVAETMVVRNEMSLLRAWIDALPERLLSLHPSLCLYHAITQLLSGAPLDVVESCLEHTAAAGDPQQEGKPTIARLEDQAQREDELLRSTELAKRVLRLLPSKNRFFRSFIASYLGITYLYGGDIVRAQESLSEAVQLGREVGNSMSVILGLCHLGGTYAVQGRLSEAMEHYSRALSAATDGQGMRHPLAGLPLIGQAEILRERNDLATATQYVLEGIELASQWGEAGAAGGYIGLARIRQAQGDIQSAREAIEKAERLAARPERTTLYEVYLAMAHAALALAQGDLDEAWYWAKGNTLSARIESGELERLTSGASPSYIQIMEYITLAQVEIALGDTGQAIHILESVRPVAERIAANALLIRILLLQALAMRDMGLAREALAPLGRGLELAESSGMFRVVLDEGRALAPLLYEATSAGIAPHLAGQLLAAFPSLGAEPDPGGRGPSATERLSDIIATVPIEKLIEPLSSRELEVLQLVANGLSNREIAQKLHLSLPTIKWHTSNIYGKLGVSTRTQAIVRAQTLGILG